MAESSHQQDAIGTFEQTITRAFHQSETLNNADRWKPHKKKWLIRHKSISNAKITIIMRTIWNQTKESIFFINLKVPEYVIKAVDKFIGTTHPWQKLGAKGDYEKTPGYTQWRKKRDTASLICALVHLVPFGTPIPWKMKEVEAMVLRDAVALANGLQPSRLYPEHFMQRQPFLAPEIITETAVGMRKTSGGPPDRADARDMQSLHELIENRNTILELQTALAAARASASACLQAHMAPMKDSATQTPPQVTGINEADFRAMLDGVLGVSR